MTEVKRRLRSSLAARLARSGVTTAIITAAVFSGFLGSMVERVASIGGVFSPQARAVAENNAITKGVDALFGAGDALADAPSNACGCGCGCSNGNGGPTPSSPAPDPDGCGCA